MKETRWGKSRITRRIFAQYTIAMISYVAGLCFLVSFAWSLCLRRTWYEWEILYQLLHWIKEYIFIIIGLLCLVGWSIITYVFMAKPLRYLDELIDAAEQMVNSPDAPVQLSELLKQVQDEMNLVREQARRNQMLAKEAEQRKNDLIVYLAHDLKTPLTSVIGYLTLLQDEPQISVETRAKYTGIALAKAERLENLINEFFDITRFNLTAMSLDMETINLSRMLEQIASEFLPILAEKGLVWDNDIEPGIDIVCDADKMERVFDNLVRNAVNYSYSDTAIHLTLETEDDRVKIRVQNRGKEIAKDKLDRIFEQFFRLDMARSSSTGGAGLGLAISKEIVELHGGTITAESRNESILFTVYLPFRETHSPFMS